MKKLNFMALMLGLLFATGVKAQSTTDYFTGKWTVTVAGTPNGDVKMDFIFKPQDGKLAGVVQDSTGKEISKVSQVTESGKSITAAFTTQGYDLTLTLEPVDADHVKGSLMNMFEAKGVRRKEN